MPKLEDKAIVNFLNELLELDRVAMSKLMQTRIKVNDAVVNNHDVIKVNGCIGFLGIVNGLIGRKTNNYQTILMQINVVSGLIIKFALAKEFDNDEPVIPIG